MTWNGEHSTTMLILIQNRVVRCLYLLCFVYFVCFISGFKSLQTLDLESCRLENGDLVNLRLLPSITSLDLSVSAHHQINITKL